eukprot:3624338-Amphidinium_carterae.1
MRTAQEDTVALSELFPFYHTSQGIPCACCAHFPMQWSSIQLLQKTLAVEPGALQSILCRIIPAQVWWCFAIALYAVRRCPELTVRTAQ